mgnify:CR=1 FL=1
MKKVIFFVLFIALIISPALAEGAGYPAPKFKNCNEAQKKAIGSAYKRFTKAVDTSSGMSEDIRKKLKKKLNGTITFNCSTSADPDCSGTCAYTYVNTAEIFLCPGGFNSSGCGCLEAVELHELVHTTGYSGESVPQECEKSCFPECAKTDPKYTGCCCK